MREHCTVKEAADYAGCAPKTIRKWIAEGRITATRPVASGSSRLRIDTASLRRLLGDDTPSRADDVTA